MERSLMIVVLNLILLCCVRARLVFPKDSDVGYIVSDNDRRSDEEILTEWQEHPVLAHADQNTVKRALYGGGRETLESKDTVERYFPGDNIEEREIESARPDERVPDGMKDKNHGVVMGVENVKCDNGKVNLTMDWDDNPVNHTCYTPKHRLKVRTDLKPYEHCDDVPPHYFPQHYCMFVNIKYNSTLPTYGPHRPLWPLWGEYKFVPIQRWLHAVEHGAIIMLYHPCTEPSLVNQLKKIVSGCIYKHVISPYNLLPVDRPLTLLGWGCYIQMSTIDVNVVKTFIKTKSMHGPEGRYAKHGKYTYGLLKKSIPPHGSNVNDTVICPN